MARYRGTYHFSTNYEGGIRGPIDAKMLVEYYSDLINEDTWRDFQGNEWTYPGMIVAVCNDPDDASKGLYMLYEQPYTIYANWIRVGGLMDTEPISSWVNSSTYYDGSLNDIRARYIPSVSLNYDDFYWDASGYLNVSVGSLELETEPISSWVNSSTYYDGSLNDIRANYIPSASLGNDFYWDNGYLEVSAISMDYAYIDGSLLARDASIEFLFNWDYAKDASITFIKNNYISQASLGNDFYWDAGLLEVSGGNIGSYLWSLASDNTTVYLTDPSDNVQLTYIEILGDGSTVFVNMPIQNLTGNVEQSYALQIDNSSALKIFGISTNDGNALSETNVQIMLLFFAYLSHYPNSEILEDDLTDYQP